MPRYPFFPGICISSARSLTTSFSGVTISSWKDSAISRQSPVVSFHSPSATFLATGDWRLSTALLRCHLQLLRGLEHFINGALHIKSLLRDIVVLAFDNILKALYRICHLHVAPRRAGELLGHVERLRQEALDLARPRHRQFLIFAEFVDAENCDDVLQVFVGL